MATRKELFARIADVMFENEEVVEMCNKYIEQLSTPRKKTVNKAAEEFAHGVATWMSDYEGEEPITLKVAAEALDVSWQKVNAAMRFLINEGAVEIVPGEKAKDPNTYVLVS